MNEEIKYPLKTSKLRTKGRGINVQRILQHGQELRELLLKNDPHRFDEDNDPPNFR